MAGVPATPATFRTTSKLRYPGSKLQRKNKSRPSSPTIGY